MHQAWRAWGALQAREAVHLASERLAAGEGARRTRRVVAEEARARRRSERTRGTSGTPELEHENQRCKARIERAEALIELHAKVSEVPRNEDQGCLISIDTFRPLLSRR